MGSFNDRFVMPKLEFCRAMELRLFRQGMGDYEGEIFVESPSASWHQWGYSHADQAKTLRISCRN